MSAEANLGKFGNMGVSKEAAPGSTSISSKPLPRKKEPVAQTGIHLPGMDIEMEL